MRDRVKLDGKLGQRTGRTRDKDVDASARAASQPSSIVPSLEETAPTPQGVVEEPATPSAQARALLGATSRSSSTVEPSGGVPSGAHATSLVDPVSLQAAPRVEAAWSQSARALAADVLAQLPSGPRAARVARAFELLLAQPALLRADVSCAVVDAQGAPLVAHRADVPTNPCSNAKVVTAAWALTVLGPGHRFATTVKQAPDGALVVAGAFDPTMTRATVDEIVRRLVDAGVREAPRLVLDVSALEGTNIPASFAKYGDEDWEYLARPEPLSVDRNVVRLTVTPGVGEGAAGVVVADSGAYAVRARVDTLAPGAQFKVACNELDNGGVLERDASGRAFLDVWGTIAADYTRGKTLVMKSPAPLEQVAFAWRDAFERAGIKVGTVDVGGPVDGARDLLVHKSKPLAAILETSLATSNAFDHEMMALATAHAEAHGPVTLAETARRLTAFLRALGVDGELVNGSGIGNDSKVPALAIAALLTRARTDARLAPLLDALARPGQTGTLKGRMLGSAAEGSAAAGGFAGKTGTGEGALALSGVSGELTMSLLVEHMKSRRDDVRSVLDAAAIVLATLAHDAP